MAKEAGLPEISRNLVMTIDPWCFTPFLSGFRGFGAIPDGMVGNFLRQFSNRSWNAQL